LSSHNALLTPEHDHELESKLILSSDYHDWNISENFIAAKNFSQSEGVEFGYAFGASRPLATLATGANCRFCRENFILGAEMYGGLGSTLGFGVHDTAHYIAPVLSWMVSDNSNLRFSPGFALTHESNSVFFVLDIPMKSRISGAESRNSSDGNREVDHLPWDGSRRDHAGPLLFGRTPAGAES